MGRLSFWRTVAVLAAAGTLSLGPVSSAMAQPIPSGIEVHCATEVTPIDEQQTIPADPVCFGSEEEVEGYLKSIRHHDPTARSANASTILGTVYQHTNRNGSSLTLWGANGGAGSVFGFSSLESGWNNSISSASGQNGCWVTLYSASSYGGSRLNCTPYCASIRS